MAGIHPLRTRQLVLPQDLALIVDACYHIRLDAIESRVVGPCKGYRLGAVFDLKDGSSWVQVSGHDEFVLRDRPTVRAWRTSTSQMALDLDGTSGVVPVDRYLGKRWTSPGAF